jgi:putative DNA primase/helicase
MARTQESFDEFEEMREQVEDTTRELRETYLSALQLDSDTAHHSDREFFSSREILRALQRDEDGDAWLFTELYRGRLAYDHAAGRWYEWGRHHWKEDLTNRALAAVESLITTFARKADDQALLRVQAEQRGQKEEASRFKNREDALLKRIRALQTVKRKNNILKLAAADWGFVGRTSIALNGEEWDRDPWLLGCKNGVVNLRTGEHQPGRPEEYIKTAAPTEWHGIDTPAPRWHRFLDEVFDGDDELVAYVQRLAGYAITGLSVEHIYPILWGRGRNGKGTLLETLAYTLGKLAGPIEAEMLLDQGRNRTSGAPRSDIMSLRGKRVAWASETEEGRRLNAGKLKWLTGGDTLTGRAPYARRQVSFRPSHTVFLLTNSRPHAPECDYALWQRIHLIPFTVSFVGNPTEDSERRANPNLLDELKAEASGILAWLVRGCLAWQEQGLNPPSAVTAAVQAYREEEDLVGRFIAERCVVASDERVRAGDLYGAYKEWSDEGRLRPLSNPTFSKRILDRFQRDSSGRHRYYLGIRLS